MKQTHGGKRKGAGRPAGSYRGRTAVSTSITLNADMLAAIDQRRADMPRSQWIRKIIEAIFKN